MDTNNITDSFNNVLRQRYLPLRHDTIIFALVQVLIEIVFPEQELRYMQATIKQTCAYRKPRYDVPFYLQERPHSVQNLCLLNMERGRKIPKSHLTQLPTEGSLTLLSQYQNHKVTNGSLISVEELVLALPFSHLIFHANTCIQFFTISPSGHGTTYPRGLLIPLI